MALDLDVASDCLIRKLDRLADLSQSDLQAIRALPFEIEGVGSGQYLVREGTLVRQCCLLLSGYACRYKSARMGNRQIVSFHLAGDILDLQHLLFPQADHSVQAITDARVAWVDTKALAALAQQRPAINEALWRDTLVDASIFREWVLNVGQRDAKSRIAHMLCEFAIRREAAGLGAPEQFELPMTQQQIAEATGLTAVHVNRMLQMLGTEGVIERQGRRFTIVDWDKMRDVADFEPGYLHLAA